MTIQNQDVETTVDVYKTTTALVSPMIEDPPIAQREHNENNLTMEKIIYFLLIINIIFCMCSMWMQIMIFKSMKSLHKSLEINFEEAYIETLTTPQTTSLLPTTTTSE